MSIVMYNWAYQDSRPMTDYSAPTLVLTIWTPEATTTSQEEPHCRKARPTHSISGGGRSGSREGNVRWSMIGDLMASYLKTISGVSSLLNFYTYRMQGSECSTGRFNRLMRSHHDIG